MKQLKIVYLVNENNVMGGVNTVVNTLGSEFVKAGHMVDVIGITRQATSHFEFDHRISVKTLYSSPMNLVSDLNLLLSSDFSYNKVKRLFSFGCTLIKMQILKSSMKKKLRQLLLDADIIIATQLGAFSYLDASFYSKTILSLHSSFENLKASKFNEKQMQIVKDHQLKLILLSKTDKEQAQLDGYHASSIYNPSNIHECTTTPFNNRLFYFGRFTEQKNLCEMLTMVDLLLYKHPEWKFEMYGSGEMESQLRAQVASYTKFNQPIRIFPFEKDVSNILKGGGILLMTSLHEGLPMTIIEAASYGIPTVAYRSFASIDELIVDHKTGRIVDLHDQNAFIESVESIVEHSRISIAKNLHEHTTFFDRDTITQQWLVLFKECVE